LNGLVFLSFDLFVDDGARPIDCPVLPAPPPMTRVSIVAEAGCLDSSIVA
jgi:hypothetical protein